MQLRQLAEQDEEGGRSAQETNTDGVRSFAEDRSWKCGHERANPAGSLHHCSKLAISGRSTAGQPDEREHAPPAQGRERSDERGDPAFGSDG